MEPRIHFEQLIAEIRNDHPEGVNICATENPLQVWLDDELIDLTAPLRKHLPLWLHVLPEVISASREEAAIISIHSPERSGKNLEIRLSNTAAEYSEQIQLDEQGKAEIEISSNVSGDILVSIPAAAVYQTVMVIF